MFWELIALESRKLLKHYSNSRFLHNKHTDSEILIFRIQSIGLGWAFRILAIVSCGVNVVCTLLVRDRNKAVGSVQMAFDIRLFRRPEFLLLLGWGFFSMLGYIVLLFSLPNYARSVGLSAKQGSVIGALLNLGQGSSP